MNKLKKKTKIDILASNEGSDIVMGDVMPCSPMLHLAQVFCLFTIQTQQHAVGNHFAKMAHKQVLHLNLLISLKKSSLHVLLDH